MVSRAVSSGDPGKNVVETAKAKKLALNVENINRIYFAE